MDAYDADPRYKRASLYWIRFYNAWMDPKLFVSVLRFRFGVSRLRYLAEDPWTLFLNSGLGTRMFDDTISLATS